MTCSALSAAVLESMAGTATRADELLLLEVRGAWGPDILAETDLPAQARERLSSWVSERPRRRVVFIRRPDRRRGPPALFVVECGEQGGVVTRVVIGGYEQLADVDLDAGGLRRPGPMWLVCTHGRRDGCCARLGVPVFDAFARLAPAEDVWQCSHQGGHRFAANVLAVPQGVQLGRVRPVDAERIAAELGAGTVPLPFYRGRTLHPPEVQAADLYIRERLADAGLGSVRYLGTAANGREHRFATRLGEIAVAVAEREGPSVPPSCGAAAEPTRAFVPSFVGLEGW